MSERFAIAQVTPHPWEDEHEVGAFVRSLSEELARRGHRMLVLAPSVGWLFWQGSVRTAIALLFWALVVVTLDNFLRPFLMTKGADLPMLLMFAGVIGGLLAFGLIGIFVGPVVLAVSYTLVGAWVGDPRNAPE